MLEFSEADNSAEARTERLYWFLRNLGLVVNPIMEDGRWCALHVAVVLPAEQSGTEPAKSSTQARVVPPVQRPQVALTVGTAQGCGDGVVDFPSPR